MYAFVTTHSSLFDSSDIDWIILSDISISASHSDISISASHEADIQIIAGIKIDSYTAPHPRGYEYLYPPLVPKTIQVPKINKQFPNIDLHEIFSVGKQMHDEDVYNNLSFSYTISTTKDRLEYSSLQHQWKLYETLDELATENFVYLL